MAGSKPRRVKDFLRGNGNKEVIIRFDERDLAEVECHCDYGVLGSDGKRRVKIPRKVELFEGGEWKPYPVAVWFGQSDNPDGIFSRAIVLQGKDFSIWQSFMGITDATLLVEAERAGIFTERINL